MSRPQMRWLGLIVWGGAVVVSEPVEAQDLQAQEARVESLLVRYRALVGSDLEVDTTPYDTLRVGELTIVTRRDDAGRRAAIEAATRSVSAHLTTLLGREADLLRRTTPLAVVVRGTVNHDQMPESVRSLPWISVDARDSAADIATKMIEEFRRTLVMARWPERHHVVRQWLDHVLPIRERGNRPDPDDMLFRNTFIELATTHLPPVRECIAGDVNRCRAVFLPEATTDRATAWYDARSRPYLVAEVPLRSWTVTDPDQPERYDEGDYRACTGLSPDRSARWGDPAVAGDDEACLRFLRRIPQERIAPPTTTAARLSLLVAALDIGGPGALGRFLSHDSDNMADLLEATSGTTVDALIPAWLAMLRAEGASPLARAAGTNWAVLAWSVLLLSLAVGSTRWR